MISFIQGVWVTGKDQRTVDQDKATKSSISARRVGTRDLDDFKAIRHFLVWWRHCLVETGRARSVELWRERRVRVRALQM